MQTWSFWRSFGSALGGRFWRVFDEIYVQVPVAVTNMRQHVLLEFSTVFRPFTNSP